MFPETSWSITVVAVGGDIPKEFLASFERLMEDLKSVLFIACLERGEKENNLHLQAAAEICWDKTKGEHTVTYIVTYVYNYDNTNI